MRSNAVMTKEQWAKVIWSDESHFQLVNRSTLTFVRRTSKEQDQWFSFRPRIQGGGGEVSIWACFTATGPGPILAYHGRLNLAGYVNLIGSALPQFLDDLSADHDCDWYFQQDNAPCHTLNWLEDQQIRLLPWLPASPDLNPIENLDRNRTQVGEDQYHLRRSIGKRNQKNLVLIWW